MISPDRINKYLHLFPNDTCCFLEPGIQFVITDHITKESYVSPIEETDSVFDERISRCEKDKKNYFYDEWQKYSDIIIPDAIY